MSLSVRLGIDLNQQRFTGVPSISISSGASEITVSDMPWITDPQITFDGTTGTVAAMPEMSDIRTS